MPMNFEQVNYHQFRHILARKAGQKVKYKGDNTFLYDHNNRMLAVLKQASINTIGHINPAQYFIRAI